jgi:large subunit ribosomal protein L4
MKAKLIDIKGNEIRDIEVNDSIYNIEPSKYAIYEAIKNELANKRQGNSSTKTKAEVQGSGAKPWRQKGTGRARVGTKRNPVWRHGGIAFGPKPRDYSYSIPKKVKKLAIKSILAIKYKSGNLKFIENFKIENAKTKNFKNIFEPLLKGEKSSFIMINNEESRSLKRAGRNLPWVKLLNFNQLNSHALYYSKNIIIIEDAAKELNNFFK